MFYEPHSYIIIIYIMYIYIIYLLYLPINLYFLIWNVHIVYLICIYVLEGPLQNSN